MQKAFKNIIRAVGRGTVWLTLAAVVACMLMIFSFSAQNAEKSTETSDKVVDIVIDVTKPDYDSLPDHEQAQVHQSTTHVVRKTAHFCEYALLGFFLFLHLNTVGYRASREGGTVWEFGRIRNRRERMLCLSTLRFGWLAALVFGVLYAVTDEAHQNFVSGRGPGAMDVLIDSVGVACGIAALALIWFLCTIKLRRKLKI